MKEIHKIEHTADLEQHVVVQKLMHEFITPIDREDINRLSHEIDAVTDSVEEVLMNVYMYRIEEITPAANEMAAPDRALLPRLKNAMEEFQNFPKTKMLHEKLVEIHDLEEQADRIYSKAVYVSYTEARTPSKCWRGIQNIRPHGELAAMPASMLLTQSRAS
ncbi:MAG: DUF47 domain-containing protein [Clostridia bacterium]